MQKNNFPKFRFFRYLRNLILIRHIFFVCSWKKVYAFSSILGSCNGIQASASNPLVAFCMKMIRSKCFADSTLAFHFSCIVNSNTRTAFLLFTLRMLTFLFWCIPEKTAPERRAELFCYYKNDYTPSKVFRRHPNNNYCLDIYSHKTLHKLKWLTSSARRERAQVGVTGSIVSRAVSHCGNWKRVAKRG